MHKTGSVGAWTFTGAAVRVAQSIKLLQDNEFASQPDRDLRRRVWWVLYDLERYRPIVQIN